MSAHEKTTMPYRPTRDESEQTIPMLCAQYPKCFFEEPRKRRPLKKNIVTDIIKDPDFDVAPELITTAVEWYTTHIGYQIITAVAGAKRIDLNGNEVGTVTEPEAIAAQQKANEIGKKLKNERIAAQSPISVLNKMRATNQISDDIVKKQDAPMLKIKPTATMAPEFAALYEILNAANVSVTGSDPTMRAMVAKMLLNKVIKKFQQVESEMVEETDH